MGRLAHDLSGICAVTRTWQLSDPMDLGVKYPQATQAYAEWLLWLVLILCRDKNKKKTCYAAAGMSMPNPNNEPHSLVPIQASQT